MQGDHAELVERLVGLGLDEREAKLYIHLAMNGPRRASDAAAATRLKRTETYRALEVLSRRGFVTAHLAKPVVYEANPPDAVFGELLASHEQRRAEIERLREHVATAVASAKSQADREAGKHGYRIMQGRRAILNHLDSVVRHAERSIALASTAVGPSGAVAPNRAWQSMVRRATEGIPTRVLLRERNGIPSGSHTLPDRPNLRLRLFEPDHPVRFLLVDDREVLFWLVSDPAPGLDARDDVAMWTNAPDFVKAQAQLFDAFWRDAKEIDRASVRIN